MSKKTLKLKPRPLVGGLMFAMTIMANAGITLTTGADTRLGDVISSIQKQSDYKFFYDDNIAAVKAKSVTFNDENVDQALKKLFDGTSVSYVVKDKVVYLRMNNGAGSGTKSQTAITRGSKTHKISGVILDENGEPLIGASVRIKGTTLGVTTDFDGNYTIETSEENPVLECTYVGYKPKEIKTNGQATVDFEMLPDSQMLDEVVVTALGIKREQKSLSYNVQQLNGDALSENKDANFINGLAGKVAGVNINASSSGVGGISKV
ncbi:MAG: carboxypeptidase-like regulatory domain-containing protein, partial [Muribaculaceae bacterium]|nr:carboxypeptidase-like regulatory domain-containing protein [Muribaculaceae bacterium]